MFVSLQNRTEKCDLVNMLNENTFASTSPLLQPRKSVIWTTDSGLRNGKEFFEIVFSG